jgi:hypothetical protein
MVTSLGIYGFLRRNQENRAGKMDNNAWFLITLLVIAILSMGSFIIFIFLGDSVG